MLKGARTTIPQIEYTPLAFVETTGKSFVDLELTIKPESGIKFRVWPKTTSYSVLAGNMMYSSDSTKVLFPLISNRGCIGLSIGQNYYFLRNGGYVNSGSQITSSTGYEVLNEEINGHVNWMNSGEVRFKASGIDIHRPLPNSIHPSYDGSFYLGTQGAIKYNNFVGRIMGFSISEGSSVASNYIPALDQTGTPCVYDTVSHKAFYNSGSEQFIAGFTLSQARKLGDLPANTTLTISLPVGWQDDEGVAAAKAKAEGNGCVLPVQEYSEGGASTYALRRVWVKSTHDDNGRYVDADGTRYQVDWCVDVWGADPETLGYERYRSVEAAVEYWGLTQYVEPETEELP